MKRSSSRRRDLRATYENRKVLILGGLGFMGRNLTPALLGLGADVTVASRRAGAIDPQFFERWGYSVRLETADTLDRKVLDRLAGGFDFLFNLAGHSGPAMSVDAPYLDLDTNVRGPLNLLEACREKNPRVRIIFPGSRQEYGRARSLPVGEDHPLEPISIYGIHKLAAERYHLAYHELYGLHTVALRISNPYGPHPHPSVPGYNIVNWFIDLALDDQDLPIFGDGSQTRDYVYIEDVVGALLIAGARDEARGQVFNVGGGASIRLIDMAERIVRTVGRGRLKRVPWPDDHARVETGDFVMDIRRIRETLGWEPQVDAEEGLRKTVECLRDGGGFLAEYMRI